MKLRHVHEVHAVPSGDQRKRHADRGHDGQNLHDVVLSDVHLRLILAAHLTGVLAQHLCLLAKAVQTAQHILQSALAASVQQVARILL